VSADRLAEIKARAEAATPGPSMVLNARLLSGDVFIEHAREDVPWLVEQVERAEAEVEWWKERFPCDGMCSDAPEEDCSRHGRSAADLWRIISEVAAERDALAAAHARESEKVWKVEEIMNDIEGSDPTTWERLRAALDADTSDTQPADQKDQS